MSYAIIRLGGKQFKVSEGDKIELERQSEAKAEVLLFANDEKVEIGTPVLENYTAELLEIKQKRGKKIRVGRFKSKSRYRKVKGHKQPLSVLEVKSLGEKSKKSEKAKTSKSSTPKKRGRPKKKEGKK